MSEQQLVTQTDRTAIEINGGGVQLRDFDQLARFCQAVHQSRLAPKGFDSPQAIMVAVQHGAEIGLGPMQALQSIAVINGRPTLFGDAALALCKAHPMFIDCCETFDVKTNTATCEVKRKGALEVVRTFSEADAKKAGLWGKAGPWSQYPARMLQMRARSFALRDSFADALKGISVREEAQDITEKPAQGRTIESPTLKLADGTVIGDEPNDFPAAPVPAKSTAAVEIAHGTTAENEAREGMTHEVEPREVTCNADSRGGGKHSQEERDEKGEFVF